MKSSSKIGSLLFGAGLFALTILGGTVNHSIVPLARASSHQDDDSSFFACSSETIRGKYATESTGSIVFGGPVGLVADVGVITFDGIHGATEMSTVSLNGTVIQRSSTSGTYSVNPDFAGPIISTSNFVILNHGSELRTIVTGAGRVIAGTAKRQ